jgi:hypothetical protein
LAAGEPGQAQRVRALQPSLPRQLEPGANWSTDHDPGFVNMDKADYRLRRSVEVFKQLKDFVHIPFEQIGLQKR